MSVQLALLCCHLANAFAFIYTDFTNCLWPFCVVSCLAYFAVHQGQMNLDSGYVLMIVVLDSDCTFYFSTWTDMAEFPARY